MKKVLITGAAGFIGFHVGQAAAGRGDELLGFDNFNEYYSPGLKRKRAELADFPIIEGDICDRDRLNSVAKDFGPTHLLHLAAQAGVRHSLTHPHSYIEANITGFLNALELARQLEIPLIYASSSSIYGMSDEAPFSLDAPANQPVSLYGATKKSNEMMAHAYHHCFGLPVTGLRYFTVYGPWGRPDMAYYSFSKRMLAGEPIELYNEGQVERDFTYIDDVVAGTLAALDRSAPFALYNLGNCRTHSVGELVSQLENHLGIEAIKKYVPMQTGDVRTTCADISLSQKELGYAPAVSLDEGVGKFVDWLRTSDSF
jgi:UDP-glucuronate 4-epimerase